MIAHQTEHIFDIIPSIGHRIGSKHYPTDNKGQNTINMLGNFQTDATFFFVPAGSFFDNDEHTVPQTPKDEVPSSAVPKTGSQEYYKQVEVITCFADTVSAERNIQIFFEPRRKRNMPSAPKFGNRLGNIRIIEVFQELKAKNRAQTDSHIRITGEIIKQLETVGNRPNPRSLICSATS